MQSFFWGNAADCEIKIALVIIFFQVPPYVAKVPPTTIFRPRFLHFRLSVCSVPFRPTFVTLAKITGQALFIQPTDACGNTMKNSRNTSAQPVQWLLIWKQPHFFRPVFTTASPLVHFCSFRICRFRPKASKLKKVTKKLQPISWKNIYELE